MASEKEDMAAQLSYMDVLLDYMRQTPTPSSDSKHNHNLFDTREFKVKAYLDELTAPQRPTKGSSLTKRRTKSWNPFTTHDDKPRKQPTTAKPSTCPSCNTRASPYHPLTLPDPAPATATATATDTARDTPTKNLLEDAAWIPALARTVQSWSPRVTWTERAHWGSSGGDAADAACRLVAVGYQLGEMARALAPLRETCRRLACDVLPGAVQAPAQGLVEPLWLIADTEAACPGLFRWVDPPERPLVLGWSAYAGELWADFTLQEQVRQQWEHFRRYRGTLACFNVKEVEGLYGQVEKLREMAVVVLGQLEAMEELSMKGAAWFGCGRCAGRVLVVLRGAVRSLGEAEVKLRADIGVLQDLEVTVHQNGKDNRPLPIDEQTLREASDRAADLAQETGRIMSRLWGWSNVIEDVEHTARELDLKRAEDLKLEMERNTKEMERNRR